MRTTETAGIVLLLLVLHVPVSAQQAAVSGTVRDQTGAALPGVTVDLTQPRGVPPQATSTDAAGRYRFDGVSPGAYTLSFRLLNFADQRRDLQVAAQPITVDAVMALALSADVVVTAKRTFANLADVDNPAENLVGIAQSASQGAITARQLDVRPLMRQARSSRRCRA
jgi:carboxypeptidase family protein